ncbi:zinc-binding alcohol dehydrogenase family protein [Chitinophaga pinensis]|uniref:Alcohol dehydrogenase zinc-binding domain protein n=1 Tax=Chitinophaga pinensis (strain ATCC 43595 / DSM 2588 / LMG 13176 / NBRC 15968 / NCIMB 11800 / UQM 2034) TaxID=485918 RepID=A0A979G769_CHIPD|nr:zinc-binding alcohol dehydrogenase family protein [Chitinophaga pinensis]ACU61892.1 Alcohol dehydrogenase zinc-binding domain protein [Chitinophaga pinensis DSM 2588]
MKAAVIYHPGGPEQLIIEERAIPEVPAGWVLVKIKAFGLNRSELMTRKGMSPGVAFPRILGIECVGEVVQDPSGEWTSGQKVAAFMGGMGRVFDGGYAEYAVLPQELLYAFESYLGWDMLGAVPEMLQTVYGSLHLALKMAKGESLLVRGGTSSIGMLAIQLAKKQGLTVTATTRKEEKRAALLKNGADNVLIDDGHLAVHSKQVQAGGFDKVLELVGTTTLKDSLQCAAPGGIVCMTGILSEQWSLTDFAPMDFIPSTVSLTIYSSGQYRIDANSFQQFIRDVETGAIRLSIGGIFTLEEIVAAHQLMDSNIANGKIVVLPQH